MYEQYTDKQIVEMLKPKLNKCTAQIDWDVVTSEPDSLWGQMFWGDILKAISIAYRSGYIRGQLGRSFIIGEKKTKGPLNAFKVGDKVKFLGLDIEDEESLGNRRFYPPVNAIGEVVETDLVYCLVRWPKGIISGDGICRCRHDYLEKVTKYWVPATKDNVKVGSKVKMIDDEAHNTDPYWFPVVGTLGIVKKTDYNHCLVQWPKETTGGDGERWSIYERLEVLPCE